MAVLIIAYIIGMAGGVLTIGSAYRMDKYLTPKGVFVFSRLPAFLKSILPLYKGEDKQVFLIYSVALDILIYLCGLFSTSVFIASLIQPQWMFISAVVSFTISAAATLQYIAEIIIAEFYKKT